MKSNLFPEGASSQKGYLSVFTISVIMPYILFIIFKPTPENTNLIISTSYIANFLIVIISYLLFFRKRNAMQSGFFSLKIFLLLFILICLTQFGIPQLLKPHVQEQWIRSQVSTWNVSTYVNALLIALIVPVYEEIVFRGCLMNVSLYWSNNNSTLSTIIVSVLFSAVHMQYHNYTSFIILFVVSCILTYSRVLTGGILTSILLHILMNVSIYVLIILNG
ncbi:CPBP family intramembrane metalloprotease [Pantoea agglomerans]|nr:CPBP family intramembrane metalloprotease [Pantoea agglomerans]